MSAAIDDAAVRYHEEQDRHRSGSRVAEVILGAQDGLVNVLGVVLGVAAATSATRVVLAAGFAAAVAESVSMAAVAYTSTQASAALYESERLRELRHVRRVPAIEREEIREIYRRKGFDGELLEQVVATITADEARWVDVMLSEEHGLAPVERSSAGTAALVGVASLAGSLLPLAPFALLSLRAAKIASILSASAVLFLLGAYKARATVGHVVRSGCSYLAIGLASALVGYGAGLLFRAS